MEKKKKPLPVIGLRATEAEQEMFKKIQKARRIPSNSHVEWCETEGIREIAGRVKK